MANAILTPELKRQNGQYVLNESDRQAILATIPPKIQHPNGIVPDFIVRQSVQYFPELRGKTNISQIEMENIMDKEVCRQKSLFLAKNATIFG